MTQCGPPRDEFTMRHIRTEPDRRGAWFAVVSSCSGGEQHHGHVTLSRKAGHGTGNATTTSGGSCLQSKMENETDSAESLYRCRAPSSRSFAFSLAGEIRRG